MIANTRAKATSSDNRYLPRWEVNNRVTYRLKNARETYECVSKDLSCTGACLMASDQMPKDSKVDMTIHLSAKTAVQVKGKIVWNKTADGKYMAGVIFQEIPPSTQETILKYAFEIKRDDLVRHWFSGWGKKS